MNAEIYAFRTPSRSASFNEELDSTISELKKSDINVLYKTELSEYEEKLFDAVKQSSTDKSNIKMIIMVNALDKDGKGTVFATLNKFSKQEISLRNNKIGGYFKKEEKAENDLIGETCPYENGPVALCSFGDGCECYVIKHRGIIMLALPKASDAKVPLSEMVCSAASKALTLDNTYGNMWSDNLFDDDMSDVLAAVIADSKRGLEETDESAILGKKEKKKKEKEKKDKKPLYKRILPWKGDGVGESVRKVILIVAVFGFVFSAVKLVRVGFLDRTINDIRINELREIYSAGFSLEPESEETDYYDPDNPTANKEIKARWREIYARYPNLVGWINISFSKWVDLPVFQPPANDPNYYLYRDYDGRDNRYGSLFVDTRSERGIDSKNIIIHGHHMNDGSMFANVTQYQSMEYYVQDPAFKFDTIYTNARWKVISVFKTNTLSEHGEFFNYLRGEFQSDSDFLNYVYQVRARSIITTPVDVNEKDQLVTLSTCSYEFKDFRTVVVARRVRNGESPDVDTSKAYYNPNPLYPDVWYSYNSGTKPTVTSFEDAYYNGKITWYDGKSTVKKTSSGYAFIPFTEEDTSSDSTSSSPSSSSASSRDDRSQVSSSVEIVDDSSYYYEDPVYSEAPSSSQIPSSSSAPSRPSEPEPSSATSSSSPSSEITSHEEPPETSSSEEPSEPESEPDDSSVPEEPPEESSSDESSGDDETSTDPNEGEEGGGE